MSRRISKISETVDYGAFSLSNTNTYYKNSLKKSFTGPDNITYGYFYDGNNQLTGIQIPNTGIFTVNDYQWNRPAAETLPGGGKRQYDYDPLMHLTNITAKDPGSNDLLQYQYTYDKVDNITAKQTEHGAYTYTYDELYRLTDTETPEAVETFTYDNVGNRLTTADTAGQWSHNANNELEGYDNTSFQYDANGNMIEKNVDGVITKFFYNLEDRLERVEDSSGNVIATYYYDPFGRRLSKEVDGTRTYFHYSDEGLIGEYNAAGAEIKSYGWKPGSTWSTDPVFMKVGGEYYWYHNDHLGTPQVMTNASGAVVWLARYTSFGKATVDPGSSVVNPLRFSGQYEDAETRLHYNWFRCYAPISGRYIKEDSIRISTLQILSQIQFNNLIRLQPDLKSFHVDRFINMGLLYTNRLTHPQKNALYIYVSNNSINYIDPKGLIIGTLLSKATRKLLGKTAQEAAVSGKVLDSGIAVGIEMSGISPNLPDAIGYISDGLQFFGGIQTFTLAATIATYSTATAALPLVLSGLAGAEIGFAFNHFYERISGQPLGADIYDWLHPNRCF